MSLAGTLDRPCAPSLLHSSPPVLPPAPYPSHQAPTLPARIRTALHTRSFILYPAEKKLIFFPLPPEIPTSNRVIGRGQCSGKQRRAILTQSSFRIPSAPSSRLSHRPSARGSPRRMSPAGSDSKAVRWRLE